MDNINYNPNEDLQVPVTHAFHDELGSNCSANPKAIDSKGTSKDEDIRGMERGNLTAPVYFEEQTVFRQISQNIRTKSSLLDMAKKWSGLCVAGFTIFLLILSWTDHSR